MVAAMLRLEKVFSVPCILRGNFLQNRERYSLIDVAVVLSRWDPQQLVRLDHPVFDASSPVLEKGR